MPELCVYRDHDFPASLNWQAVSFMRVEWPHIEGGLPTTTYPAEVNPTHFASVESAVLLSYAATMQVTVCHTGAAYRIGGLGNVLTYPGFRRRGFGGVVVRAATEHLDASNLDVGCLFCAQNLVPFYGTFGWVPVTEARTLIGREDASRATDEMRMMRFISDHGREGQHDLMTRDLHLDYSW